MNHVVAVICGVLGVAAFIHILRHHNEEV